MNSWGWFVIALGALAVIMAVRNSVAAAEPLVPGSGGVTGDEGAPQMSSSGPGPGTNSLNAPTGGVSQLPTSPALPILPRPPFATSGPTGPGKLPILAPPLLPFHGGYPFT